MRAEMTDQSGVPWASEVLLRAEANGTLDLARAVPLSGSYADADAMGHIWSMVPAAVLGRSGGERREYIRETRTSWFVVEEVTRPTAVTLTLEREAERPIVSGYERLNVAPEVSVEPLRGMPTTKMG